MSFLRSVFFGKPDQTEQEYVNSLVKDIVEGKDIHNNLISLKELFPKFVDSIAEDIIPPLISLLATEKEDDGILSHVFYYLFFLLSDENEKKVDYANIILHQQSIIHNLVGLLFSKERKRINVTIKFIKRLSLLSPNELQNIMVTENDDMIQFFSKIEDKDPQFRQDFLDLLPLLINNSPDMQNIVGFNALNQLVELVAPGRDSIIDILQSVLKDNKITQKLFTDSGYLTKFQSLIKINSHKGFELLSSIFSNGGSKEFQDQISVSGIIEITIENIISGNERLSNLEFLTLIIQNAPKNCSIVSKQINQVINLYNTDFSIRAVLLPFFKIFFSSAFEDDISNVFNEELISKSPVQIYDIGTIAILSNRNILPTLENLLNASIDQVDKAIPPALRFSISACDSNSENCKFYLSQSNSLFIHLYCILMDTTTRPDVSHLIALFFKILLCYQNDSTESYLNKLYTTLIGDEQVNSKLLEGKSEAFDDWNNYNQEIVQKMINWNVPIIKESHIDSPKGIQSELDKEKIQFSKEVEKLNTQINQMKLRESELLSENSILQATAQEKTEKITNINNELNATKEQIDKMHQNVLDLEHKLQDLTNNCVEKEEMISKADKKIQELSSENEALHRSLSELDSQGKEEVIENNQKLIQYQIELNENTQTIKSLNSKIEKIESDLQQSENDKQECMKNNDYLQSQVSDLQAVIEKLNNNLSILSNENSNKDMIISNAKEEQEKLTSKITALEKEISENNSKDELFQAQKGALNSIIADLKQKIDEKNDQMDNLRRTISDNIDNDDEAADLRRENSKLKDEIDHIQSEMDKAHKENNDIIQRMEKLKQCESNLIETEKILKEKSDECEEKSVEIGKLNHELDKAKSQIEYIQSEKERCAEDLSNIQLERDNYLEQINDYKKRLEEMELLKAKENSYSSTSSEDENRIDECDQLRNELINLQKEITESNKRHEEEINSIKRINSDLILKGNDYEEQIKAKDIIVSDMQNKLAEQKNSTELIQKAFDQTLGELNQAKEKIIELEDIKQKYDQLIESEKLIDFPQNSISEIAADIAKSDTETLTQIAVEKDCEFEAMKNDLIQIKSERDTLQRNIDQLETKYISTKAELESTIRSKDSELVEANERLRRLQQESSDRDSLIFRIKELEDILAKERGLNNKALTARLATTEAETSSLRRELEKAAARHSRLVADRDSLSETNQELRAALEDLKNAHDRDREKWARKRAALEEEISGFRGQLDIEVGGLKARLADTERRMADGEVIAVRAPTDEELEHINSMRTTVLRFDQENQRLAQENTELRLRVAQLEDGDLAVKLRAATRKIAKLNKLLQSIPDAELLKTEVAELRTKVKFYKRAASEAKKEADLKLRALTEQLEVTSSRLQSAQVENTQLANELNQAKANSFAEEKFALPELPPSASEISASSALSASSATGERKTPVREEDSEHKKALRLIGKMWLADQMRSPK